MPLSRASIALPTVARPCALTSLRLCAVPWSSAASFAMKPGSIVHLTCCLKHRERKERGRGGVLSAFADCLMNQRNRSRAPPRGSESQGFPGRQGLLALFLGNDPCRGGRPLFRPLHPIVASIGSRDGGPTGAPWRGTSLPWSILDVCDEPVGQFLHGSWVESKRVRPRSFPGVRSWVSRGRAL